MKKQIITLAVATLLLSSCGIYTKYERPEIKTDGLYGQDVEVEDTTSIASLSWRELFTDPQLQSLIEHALQGNTDLQSAQWRIKEAEATLSSARLAYLPSFMLTPQGGVSSFDKSKGSWTYSGIASASWEIDIFGKLTNAKRRAKALYLQSLEYEQAVTTSLIANVANMYYTLLMLDEQINITTETIENWKEYIHSLRVLMKSGQADRAAVSQAEASRLGAEASLLDLKQQIVEMENSLCSLLAWQPAHIERSSLDCQVFPQELSVGVPLELLSRRPDVMQAEAELNQARSDFYPSITLSGSAGWTNNAGATITNPGTWLLQAVGSLVQPIFNRGKNIANLKISKAQREEALLQFQQSLLDAGGEVNNALNQWQNARKKVVLDGQQVEYLSVAVHDTRLLMEHGTTNYLEVLTAQQSLLSSRLTLVSDRNSEIQSVISLYHALGGGSDN